METLELEKIQFTDNSKFCHILCCHSHLSLCGAFKPKVCGTGLVDSLGVLEKYCHICNRKTCPDCLTKIFERCPYCNR